ncbi:hypothetical protein GJAV_G00023450 [Gymnothorax javanicus]|nr:hypothetical protein GJAV_G00023450 [Gymnothorax javanicus]
MPGDTLKAVQGSVDHKGELFGIRNLFRLQTSGNCITRQILEREGRVEAGVLTAQTRTGAEERTQAKSTESGPSEAANAAEAGAGSGPGAGSGVLDFSSTSEGEDEGDGGRGGGRNTKSRVEEAAAPRGQAPPRLTLLQHGFSKLLQVGGAGVGHAQTEDQDSQEGSGGEDPPIRRLTTDPRRGQGWSISSDSDGGGAGLDQGLRSVAGETPSSSPSGGSVKHKRWRKSGGPGECVSQSKGPAGSGGSKQTPDRAAYDSDESDHIELLKPADSRKTATSSKRISARVRFRKSPDIQSCTSSDDELPAKKPRASREHGSGKEFTSLRSRRPPGPDPSPGRRAGKEAAAGAVDRLLVVFVRVGLQVELGVAYTHSNQHVIGSSRAEAHISRTALRHVFHCRKYSQVPANQLMDSMEVLSEPVSPPEQSSIGVQTEGRCDNRQHVKHPVTHSLKAIRHTRTATIIMGETPSAICRKQLEDMVLFFKAPSLAHFAREVLTSTPAQRQARLRRFYRDRNPELSGFLDQMLPEPEKQPQVPVNSEAEPSSSSSSSRRKWSRVSGRFRRTAASGHSAEDLILDQPEPRPREGEEGQNCASPGPSPQTHSHLPVKETSVPRPTLESPPNTSALLGQPVDRRASSEARGPRKGEQRSPKSPKSEDQEHFLLTDLLGDTSVLDDLFRPRARAGAPGPSTSAPTRPPQSSRKTCRKDFWDILNDGDEESLNQLADLSRAERICRGAGVTVSRKAKPDAGEKPAYALEKE